MRPITEQLRRIEAHEYDWRDVWVVLSESIRWLLHTLTFRLVLVLLGSLLLTGCATWVRPPGVTEAEFQQDWYSCAYAANALPRTPQSVTTLAYGYPLYSDPTLGWSDVALSSIMRQQCLEARGYRRQ